jgi:hypothetical protein
LKVVKSAIAPGPAMVVLETVVRPIDRDGSDKEPTKATVEGDAKGQGPPFTLTEAEARAAYPPEEGWEMMKKMIHAPAKDLFDFYAYFFVRKS